MIAEKFRKSILYSAIQGKLTSQNNNEDSYAEHFKISEERVSLIKNKVIKNEKFKMVVDESEKEYNIPSNWVWVKLGSIITLKSGQDMTPDKYNASERGIPYITGASNIHNGVVNINRWTEFPASKAKLGDLLITCKGTVGEMCYLEEREVHIARQIMAINTVGDTNLEYIRYFLSVQIVELNRRAKSIIPGISRKTLLEYNIPLPPFNEQKRIVKKLKTMLPMIDVLEKDERKLEVLMNKFPNQIRESVLKSAITGKLTQQNDEKSIQHDYPQMSILDSQTENSNDDLPANWSLVKLGNISRIKNGSTPKKSVVDYWNSNDVPWFTVNDIRVQGRIIDKTEQYITNKALGDGKRLIPKNSVLLCCTASLGEYAFTNIDLTTNQQFNGISVLDEYKEHVYPMYLFYWVQTLKKEMYEKAGKTTFPFLSTKKLSEFLVPIPPFEEQKRIVEKLDNLLPLIDKLYT